MTHDASTLFRPIQCTSSCKEDSVYVDKSHVYVLEYSQQYPVIRPVVGMQGQLVHTYRKHLHGRVGSIGCLPSYGTTVPLNYDDISPLASSLHTDERYTVYQTEISRTAVYEHDASHDFLVFEYHHRTYIKPIQVLFLAGQVEPTVPVFGPVDVYSPSKSSLIRPFLESWLSPHTQATPSSPYLSYFPPSSSVVTSKLDSSVHPVTMAKLYAYMEGMKQLERESHIQLVSRESIFVLVAVYRIACTLLDARIQLDTALSQALGIPLPSHDPLHHQRRIWQHIVHQCEHAPWVQSLCYYWLCLKAEEDEFPFQAETTMRVYESTMEAPHFMSFLPKSGASKPDSDSETLLDTHIPAAKSTKTRDPSESQETEKQVISGTEKDIRTVHMNVLADILIEIGWPAESLPFILRWDRCWLILMFATYHPNSMYLCGGELVKYFRRTLQYGVDDMVKDSYQSILSEDGARKLNRRKLERTSHFCSFRDRAAFMFHKLRDELRGTEPIAPRLCIVPPSFSSNSPSPTHVMDKEDEDLDMFATILMQRIFEEAAVKQKSPSPVIPLKKRPVQSSTASAASRKKRKATPEEALPKATIQWMEEERERKAFEEWMREQEQKEKMRAHPPPVSSFLVEYEKLCVAMRAIPSTRKVPMYTRTVVEILSDVTHRNWTNGEMIGEMKILSDQQKRTKRETKRVYVEYSRTPFE